MRGDDPAVLEDLHRSGAATDLDPLADMTERHTVLPPLEGYQRVKANTAQDDDIERFRQRLGQRGQLLPFGREGLGDGSPARRKNHPGSPLPQLSVGPPLHLLKARPGPPPWLGGKALVAHPPLDL